MTASPAPLRVPQRDVSIWRGDDDPPIVWEFRDAGFPGLFVGATFLLLIQWGVKSAAPANAACLPSSVGEFTQTSETGALIVDPAACTVSWAPTPTEFAAFPRGVPARYELKRIVAGKIRTLIWGEVRLPSGLLRNPGETPGPIGQGYTDIQVAALRSELLATLAAFETGQGGGSVFKQATPSASWAIPHTFGRLPSVAVYDASGSELIADISATPTMVSVVFAQATVGSAILT